MHDPYREVKKFNIGLTNIALDIYVRVDGNFIYNRRESLSKFEFELDIV